MKLVSNLGTENGIMASLQCIFRDDLRSHQYVPSPRNQRIESWLSYFRKTRTTQWMKFFKYLEEQEILNQSNELQSDFSTNFAFATGGSVAVWSALQFPQNLTSFLSIAEHIPQ